VLQRIDHLVVPVPSLAPAAAAYQRLGLALTPPTTHAGMGTANCAAFIGPAATSFAYIELLAVEEPAHLRHSRRHYLDAIDRGGGLASLAFTVNDLDAACDRLRSADTDVDRTTVRATNGRLIVDTAVVHDVPDVPFPLLLVAYPEAMDARFQRSRSLGRFDHTFPLSRLDHVAILAPGLEGATRAWVDLLGLAVAGEITTPTMAIRQLRCGDAVVELLSPVGESSPLAGRPAALLSVAAWEVAGDLAAAAALARERGFTCPPPEPGVIPGTVRTTIPAAQLGGLSMQLLQYTG
jgi:catechol 2,3-dioxygenase-like lactoylglutathione lyase family enzyme